jgi:ribonuclease P protein component
MFSRQQRLSSEKDIQRLLKSKLTVFDAACGLRWCKRSDGLPNRFMIVIGTKIDKRAVVRNRARRQYREICKQFVPSLGTGYDIALFVGKPALPLLYREKYDRLLRVFKKSGLFLRTPVTPIAQSGGAADRGVSKNIVV